MEYIASISKKQAEERTFLEMQREMNIDPDFNSSSLIGRAYRCLPRGDIKTAKETFNIVLLEKSNNIYAHLGLFMCYIDAKTVLDLPDKINQYNIHSPSLIAALVYRKENQLTQLCDWLKSKNYFNSAELKAAVEQKKDIVYKKQAEECTFLEMQREMNIDPDFNSSSLIGQAYRYLPSGDIKTAKETFNKVLLEKSNNIYAYLGLFMCYIDAKTVLDLPDKINQYNIHSPSLIAALVYRKENQLTQLCDWLKSKNYFNSARLKAAVEQRKDIDNKINQKIITPNKLNGINIVYLALIIVLFTVFTIVFWNSILYYICFLVLFVGGAIPVARGLKSKNIFKCILIGLIIAIVFTAILTFAPRNNSNSLGCSWCNGAGIYTDSYGRWHSCSHCHGTGIGP